MGADNAGLSHIGEHVMEGISRVDADALDVGLDATHNSCEGVEGMSYAVVSHDGHLEHARTLAGRIAETHGSAASWGHDDEVRAWDEAVSY